MEGLYTAAGVRELDRIAIEEAGIPGYTLMRRAGAAVHRLVAARLPPGAPLLVLCGLGNNAGDGYVVARLARQAGRPVTVLTPADPQRLRGDARRAFEDAAAAGIVPVRYREGDALPPAGGVVDALLGTGLERPVTGAWRTLVEGVNALPVPRIAVDVPSGLDADRGTVLGIAFRAEATVTFIGRKLGLYTAQAADHTGRVHFDALGVPEAVRRRVTPVAWRMTAQEAAELLAPRPRTLHKGHAGHVLVIGGQPGMSGAARLAGEAAARVGAGLVSLAVHPAQAACAGAGRPELMVHAAADGALPEGLARRATVLAVGPGLGESDWARRLWDRVLSLPQPKVVDADALRLLAEAPRRREDWILTPHPGEAARLLGATAAEVQADRPAAVRALQARYGGVVVLKGPGTLVHDGHRLLLSDTGNPGMASGGMGDVLTGVIAGLLAQGIPPLEAAALGAWVHGAAADRAAQRRGERGLLAQDLMGPLQRLVNPGSVDTHTPASGGCE
ncbi:MAG: NAD(P)H-hydrate dehydratase [Gammaproteobacteria bacterium]|nr:MAG: NAD(P)H-hydrate dehydratase [Gammaproteobacteria bacterium]